MRSDTQQERTGYSGGADWVRHDPVTWGKAKNKAFSLTEPVQGDGSVRDHLGPEKWSSGGISEKSLLSVSPPQGVLKFLLLKTSLEGEVLPTLQQVMAVWDFPGSAGYSHLGLSLPSHCGSSKVMKCGRITKHSDQVSREPCVTQTEWLQRFSRGQRRE